MLAITLNSKDLPYPEPIHPIIVHFVIAMVLFSFCCDLLGFFTKNYQLYEVSWWNLFVAAIAILFAVFFGQLEAGFSKPTPEAQGVLNFHTVLGWTLSSFVVFMASWRYIIRYKKPFKLSSLYLIIATVLAGLVTLQSYLGSCLVWIYGLHVEPVVQTLEKTGAL